jgi:hypothetical protein
MTGYAQTRKDYDFLNSIIAVDDQVSLMDQVQDLMENPNKAYAQSMYEGAIGLWFSERRVSSTDDVPKKHRRRVNAIKKRYHET